MEHVIDEDADVVLISGKWLKLDISERIDLKL